jgi:hypothetical protein
LSYSELLRRHLLERLSGNSNRPENGALRVGNERPRGPI